MRRSTHAKGVTVVEPTKAGHWASSSTMVRPGEALTHPSLIHMLGVDACNTVLEVLLFAAATNLGQSWNTVLTLFGGKPTILLLL